MLLTFKSFTLRFSENPQIVIPASGVTILVGPNASGKSLVLREIEGVCQQNQTNAKDQILSDFEVIWPSAEAVEEYIAGFPLLRQNGHDFVTVESLTLMGEQSDNIHIPSIRQSVSDRNKDWAAQSLMRAGVLRLDGRSRFGLTGDLPATDLLSRSKNILGHFFVDDAARKKLREAVFEGLGLYLVIDPTAQTTLRIRLSKRPPLDDEQSLNVSARKFHAAATHIKDASDGVQAFVGILLALQSGDYHTILLDEPEAFLHPPLARKLGRHAATIASKNGGCLITATHSPDFLMGCVQSGQPTRIIRLEYHDGKSSGRLVDQDSLKAILRSPLMRSSNIISGLFYDGVVVTESDNDRVFYSEIYARLAEKTVGAPAILFVNAQNKQTLKTMVLPMRRFGVPTVAIPDIDVIKDGGSEWTQLIASAQIPSAMYSSLSAQRVAIKEAFETSGYDMKSGGITLLAGQQHEAAGEFFNLLERYGLFVVQTGELESWLPDLKIPGKKTDWTVAMLSRLGLEPQDVGYVPTGSDDVWCFMRRIMAWVANTERKGIARGD